MKSDTTHSLTETAQLHDMSKGYLSRCLKEGKEAKGHDLRPYAVYTENGHVKHFEFPPDYVFPTDSLPASQGSSMETTNNAMPVESSPPEQRVASTEEVETQPYTVELYQRKDWLSKEQAIELMAMYLPIDPKHAKDPDSKTSQLLRTITMSFEHKRTQSYGSRSKSYVLRGKVLAVIRQVQNQGMTEALWTVESKEWQNHIHEELGLSKENGLDVEAHSSW